MPREHGDKGEFVETVTLDDVLGVFDQVRGPVVFSADVADELGCSRETARRKLKTLHERGDVDRRKVARRVVYWRPEAESGRERHETTTTDDRRGEHGVHDERTHDAGAPGDADALSTVEFPATRDREACERAVRAARDYLRAHDGATKAVLVRDVMPEHPLGYDVDDAIAKVESEGRYRGGWWRTVVKPGLKALGDVEAPPRGASTWEYTGP